MRIDAPSDLGALGVHESQALLDAIVAGVGVRRRFEFFVWTQGQLQALLPHGILVCGLPRGGNSGMFFEYFYNVPVAGQVLADLCNPRDGAAAGWLQQWRCRGFEPLALSQRGEPGAAPCPALARLGFPNAIAHGIPTEQVQGGAFGFFAFVALARAPGLHEQRLVELLVPHLFSAYSRALAPEAERERPAADAANDGTLTDRELEILRWVRDGKSNQEVGMVLAISPLTVKNHIQRILRKLSATNRAQAVSKAIALKLLDAERFNEGEVDERRGPALAD